ncbi:MAG: hypothetical protein AAF195_03300, partial [Pseudomonadota bacterium]
MLLFCLTSILLDGIIRYLSLGGFNSIQTLFIRSFFVFLILLPIIIQNNLPGRKGILPSFMSKKIIRLYAISGIFAFIAIASWFHILQYVDFTALMAIGFTSPLFTV